MKTALEHYHARMQRVLDHIEQHLDDDLDLDVLSRVAAFSKFHFHRQFSALFGISPHRYVQLARMKRASYRLAFRETDAVTDIALDAVYENSETFTRVFRERIGQSPSEFRQTPEWESWLATFDPLTKARNKYMTNYSKDDVNIVEFSATAIAVMEHRGDPTKIGDTIQQFIAWRKTAGLPPRVSDTFNIFHTDPLTASPAEFHMDLCASTDRKIAQNDAGVRAGTIPAGRCAVLRMTGSSDDLEEAATFLYRAWLPASGEDTRDFPFFCQRISFFPDVPENAAVTDLFVPLK